MASDLAHPPSPSRSTHVPGSLSQRPRLPEWVAHPRPSDLPAPGTDEDPKGPRGTQRRPCSTRLLAAFRWDFPSFRATKEQQCSSNSKDSEISLQRIAIPWAGGPFRVATRYIELQRPEKENTISGFSEEASWEQMGFTLLLACSAMCHSYLLS